MKTLKDILEDYYTGEPETIAEWHLEDFLTDLEEAGAFSPAGARNAQEMMDNLRRGGAPKIFK